MSDLRDLDDSGYMHNSVCCSADGIGADGGPLSMVRLLVFWGLVTGASYSHNAADLVERSIDRGEA